MEIFTQRNFVAEFIRLQLTFTQKTKKMLFEPHFRGLRSNVHTARWKPDVDFLFVLIELLLLSLTVETL